jgi:hypothetical protein
METKLFPLERYNRFYTSDCPALFIPKRGFSAFMNLIFQTRSKN